MKTGLIISICFVCGVSSVFAASFGQVAIPRSHPRAVEVSTHVQPEKPPGTLLRARPINPSGLLPLSGTAPDGVYHRSSNPAALGRLLKPSGATPAVLAGTRINRKL